MNLVRVALQAKPRQVRLLMAVTSLFYRYPPR